MSKRWKKLTEEVVHQNKWWSAMHDTFELPSGTKGDYYYAKTLGGAAMVVPILSDGRLVMVAQYRYLADKISTEFPCGGVENGEDHRTAALRELQEEAGCSVKDIKEIGVFEPCNGYVSDVTHVFLAHVEFSGNPKQDEMEQIEVLVRTKEEIETMVRDNQIWDGQSLAAWALVQTHINEESKREVNTEDPILSRVLKTFFHT